MQMQPRIITNLYQLELDYYKHHVKFVSPTSYKIIITNKACKLFSALLNDVGVKEMVLLFRVR